MYSSNKQIRKELAEIKPKNTGKRKLLLALLGAVLFCVVIVFVFLFGFRQDSSSYPTREDMLADFDYLMDALEANFPFFDLAYRNGVDIRSLGRQARERLADDDRDVNTLIFANELESFFRRSRHTGHLSILDRTFYLSMIYEANNNLDTWGEWFLYLFTHNPNTVRFYGEFDDDDLAQAHMRAVSMMYAPIRASLNIIEEGRIASIRFPHMNSARDSDRENFAAFYQQIADFEHLIIDIRGNPGGWPFGFFELVIAPHISYPIYMTSLAFYRAGEANLRHLDGMLRDFDFLRPSHFYNYPFRIVDGRIVGRNNELLTLAPLPHHVLSDLEAFDYYHIGITYTIYPSDSDGVQSNFSGKLWLLIDERNASGADHAIALFMQAELGTVVGTRTMGVYSDPFLRGNYIVLPATGIIVMFDMSYPVCHITGRALEEGASPHFYNLAGKNALETALFLIHSGLQEEE